MKLNYYAETDSLYIKFSEKMSAESIEISEGIVIDYDSQGNITGIDIDNAAHKIQLNDFFLEVSTPILRHSPLSIDLHRDELLANWELTTQSIEPFCITHHSTSIWCCLWELRYSPADQSIQRMISLY